MSLDRRVYQLEEGFAWLKAKFHSTEKELMTLADDVKAAADKAVAADTAVVAAVTALKGQIADLNAKIAALPPAMTDADVKNLQDSVDELNKGADAVTAAIS